MAQVRGVRARRSPPSGDFVTEPLVGKKRPSAPTLCDMHPLGDAGESLPKQWPARKRSPPQLARVAKIDNVTLLNELKRRGLLAPEMQVRPHGFRWTKAEDARLEEAINVYNVKPCHTKSITSPWHAVAQHVGQRSFSACKKRWELLHPDWNNIRAGSETVPYDPPVENVPYDPPVEDFYLDTLLEGNPADEHYGLLALEAFTDVEDQNDDNNSNENTHPRTLASFSVPTMLCSKRISFAFPKGSHTGARKWDKRLLREHSISLHQQQVTSVYLEMRAKRMLDLDPNEIA